jgi:hypothetical protein
MAMMVGIEVIFHSRFRIEVNTFLIIVIYQVSVVDISMDMTNYLSSIIVWSLDSETILHQNKV